MLAIYCRISGKKGQGEDTSIDIQKEKGIAFAKKIHQPYKIFTDICMSGACDDIEDRPDFA